jgi:hypothetical protein
MIVSTENVPPTASKIIPQNDWVDLKPGSTPETSTSEHDWVGSKPSSIPETSENQTEGYPSVAFFIMTSVTSCRSSLYDLMLPRTLLFHVFQAHISRKRYRNKNLFVERAKPAMRTWAKGFKNVWFVMERGAATENQLQGCDRSIVAAAAQTAPSLLPSNWTVITCGGGGGGGGSSVSSSEIIVSTGGGGGGGSSTRSKHSNQGGQEEEKEEVGGGAQGVDKPVLVVECDNGYWGTNGPCCKCEEALRFVVDSDRGRSLLTGLVFKRCLVAFTFS